MPSAAAARAMRIAISPRFATSSRARAIGERSYTSARAREKWLASTSARTSTSSRSPRRAPEARAHHPAGGDRAAVADAVVREAHAHWPCQRRGEGELLQLETE